MSFTVAWPKCTWLHGWLSRRRGAGRSDKLQDVISVREVGQLRGRRLHLGSSLEVITMSNPFSPGEGDPEVLFWPLTTSSALPCLQPALGYRFHSFHRPYVIINNNNDDKSSDLFKLEANAPFILWPMSWQINQWKGKVNSEGKRSLDVWAGENKSFLLFRSVSRTQSQPQTEIGRTKQAEWQPAGNQLKLRRSMALIG